MDSPSSVASSPHARALRVALTLLATWLAPASAHACYDEALVQIGRVRIVEVTSNEGSGWDLDAAAQMALRARRLDALLPPFASVEIADSAETSQRTLRYCIERGRRCVTTDVTRLSESDVLRLVARQARATPAALRAAERLPLTPMYTIQLFASRDPARARALIDRLAAIVAPPLPTGDYDAYGVPAMTSPGHLETVTRSDGTRWYRVLLGAFQRRADAEGWRAAVARDAGLRGFVRAH